MASNTIRCAVITASVPKCVSKKFELVDGELKKVTSASVSRGVVEIIELEDGQEFAELLIALKPSQCLTYGIPSHAANIVTEDEWESLGRPSSSIPRSKSTFFWPQGPGVMMLDYDAPKDGTPALGRKKLVTMLLEICPALNDSALVWWPSTSSHIYAGEKELLGLKGQRIYIFVKDATDIERAGAALNTRLWAKGHGRFEVSASGRLLNRSIFDASVWQPSHIDFAAGAVCAEGLQQRRGVPQLFESTDHELLDTRTAIPDPSPEELVAAGTHQAKWKSDLKEEARQRQAEWVEARCSVLRSSNSNIAEEHAMALARRVIETNDLTGDWTITIKQADGSRKDITVRQALEEPEIYHGALTLDPLEPEYDGGRWVGKLYIKAARPNLFSFAHGGVAYRLHHELAQIELVSGRSKAATDEFLAVLRSAPDIYDFGAELVRVGDAGRLHPLDDNSLRYFAGGLIQFWRKKINANGAVHSLLLDPPPAICSTVVSLGGQRELKKLNGVITAPTLRPDGSVLDAVGYDQKTHLLYDPLERAGVVPTKPTRQQATAALNELWHPFKDFPFCSSLDRAVHLAALLTAAVRPGLGVAPGFAYDAPIQGSGKTLLARCVGVLVQGTDPGVWPHVAGKDDEEIRKRLFTVLRTGAKVLIWDNVVGAFDSAAMASCMTSPTLTDRILGQSTSCTLPNRMMLILTGNNLLLQGEMPRRVLVSRIDPASERPYAREFDMEPFQYCRVNRQRMIAAALTLIRAYLSHGDKPQVRGKLASFEEWDAWVRRTVLFANHLQPGMFGDVMESITANQAVDPEQESLLALLKSWHTLHGDRPVTASQVIKSAIAVGGGAASTLLRDALDGLPIPNASSMTVKSFGKYLAYRKGRVVGGLVLERLGKINDLQAWRVQCVGAETGM